MSRDRQCPCHPHLDSILEAYFLPDGASIKSSIDFSGGGGTDPTELTREEVAAEVGKLLMCLTSEELQTMARYYRKRAEGDRLSRRAAQTRGESRNISRGRRFRTGIAEVERVWSEQKKAGRRAR